MYKRWEPPKAAKPKPPLSPAVSAVILASPSAPKPVRSESGTPKPKKRKRTIEQPYPIEIEEPQVKSSPRSVEVAVDSPKPKKEKKRKREQDQQDENVAIKDEAVPKKHKGVLSKFERSSKIAEVIRADLEKTQGEEVKVDSVPVELHDLVPLPQPEPVPEAPFRPTFSDLPPWLEAPITVPSEQQRPFRELGIDVKFTKMLEDKGFSNALAVQSQIIPMLRPGPDQHLGDLCVLAKTGSGKTLAYLLPMIEAMKDRTLPKLSVLIVVPTRILVNQVHEVAKDLCANTKLKIGTATGEVPLATERRTLVKVTGRYNPERAEELQQRAKEQLRTGFVPKNGIMKPLLTMLPGHIPHYESNLDILICTPGRLIEHIETTTGFLLRDVQWVVFDEADQLLEESFHNWAEVLMTALHGETTPDFMNAREKLCRSNGWEIPRNLTKVVVSATITKDLAKLETLRLKRPKLVVIRDDESKKKPSNANQDTYELPATLQEFAIPVGDGSNKPLYLVDLLRREILIKDGNGFYTERRKQQNVAHDEDNSAGNWDSDPSSSESDLDSDSSSSSSSETDKISSADESLDVSYLATEKPTKSPEHPRSSSPNNHCGSKNRVLIFTKSNEHAGRLSHLIASIHPPFAAAMGALVRGSTTSEGKKLLNRFRRGKIQILIATDKASRGLDIPDLTHVVNYDIPHDIPSYVHRVGRTARAEKSGQAWTLITNPEARWFWHEIARSRTIKRGARIVQKIKLDAEALKPEHREAYEQALQALQEAVEGHTEVKPKKR